jgi:eukaryotic-like serine/threonine-protein kinase
MTLQPGTVLNNRYRIVKLLAQGGFGTLFRAWDMALGRPCALKENLETSDAAQRQFLREAKILGNLTHPNLPRVTDHFYEPGLGQYLVMDYIEGQDLQEMLEDRGGPLPETQVLPWIGQVCEALSYMHSQKPPVIHRDIKPANIKITPEGQAMLVDFGIAKVYDSGIKTTIGAQAVTPGFSPYEQYGKGKTDARTDIYALGATLYTLLTAQEPLESVQRMVNDPLTPPRQLNPGISLRTSVAVMRAMQMDASQRFQSAADFKQALIPPVVRQMVAAARPAPATPVPVPAANRTLPLGWIGVVGALSILVITLLLILLRGRTGEPTAAASTMRTAVPAVTQAAQVLESLQSPGPSVTSIMSAAVVETQTPQIPPLVYSVQVGDTCSEIAERYGVSIKEIVALNNLTPDCGLLYAGQTLLVPGRIASGSPTAAHATAVGLQPAFTRVAASDGMQQVYISSGGFLMGASETDMDAGAEEKPQHSVYVSAFWIDRYEVTNAQYEQCVLAGKCPQPAKNGSKTRPAYFDSPDFSDYPVIFVSWEDARAYCEWAGRRLPSEAEWEKAARGTEGQLYPWGKEAPRMGLANFNGQVGDTKPVGTYPEGASPYGALDMAGNVSEWVADWFGKGYYVDSPAKNPPGPDDGEFRILRGGSWFNQSRAMRAAFRLWNLPSISSDSIGFRCAH